MPLCASHPESRALALVARFILPPELLLLAGCLTLSACAPTDDDFGFSIKRIDAAVTDETLRVTVRQSLDLSAKTREALRHGVPISIQTTVAARAAGAGRDAATTQRITEIRYLPLSDHYRLADDAGRTRTFPRLRHVLAALSELELELASLPRDRRGAIEIRARSTLLRRALPPPMQLPTWLSADWKHDSGWHSSILQPDAPA